MRQLTGSEESFIVHWGEMGTRWGLNRSVAQIYALLLISEDSLTAEEISKSLSMARSTVSAGLHELQGWQLIRVVNILGDRRDHFAVVADIWETFRLVIDERKRREMDPTTAMLRKTLDRMETEESNSEYSKRKLTELLEFFEVMHGLYNQIENVPVSTLKRLAQTSNLVSRAVSLIRDK